MLGENRKWAYVSDFDLVLSSSVREVPKGSEFAYFAETKFCFGGSEIKIMESGSKEAGGSDINISAVSRP